MAFAHQDIIDLIKTCRVATVSCAEQEKPYSFNCFYAFVQDTMILLFKSSDHTKHARILSVNPWVSGTIVMDNGTLANNAGIQFEGAIVEIDDIKLFQVYYLRYPFAASMPGKLFALQLNAIKFTSTKMGIRHKKEWKR